MIRLLAVNALILVFLSGSYVLACKCTDVPTTSESFADSDAVVFGTVESITRRGYRIYAVFSVESSWKGVDRKRILLLSDGTSCDIDYEVGDQHYLWLRKDKGIYYAMPCSRHGGSEGGFLGSKTKLDLRDLPPETTPPPAESDDPAPGEQNGGEKTKHNPEPNASPSEQFDWYPYLIAGIVFMTSILTLIAVCLGILIGRSSRK